MNQVVQGALIGVGGSVIVAIVGFLTTRSLTKKSIDASTANTIRTLDAAREERVWQQRATAYLDAITAVRWQQERRQRQVRTLAEGLGLIPSREPSADKPPVDWAELSPRLFAFASPAVLKALRAASDAGADARNSYRYWEEQVRDARAREADQERQVMSFLHSAREKAMQAVQAANDKDDALTDAIRADLHGEAGRVLEILRPQPSDDDHEPSSTHRTDE